MTKPKTKIMGRPRIEIDFEQFEKLCNYQATIGEIASWFDMSVDTLEERIRRSLDALFRLIHRDIRTWEKYQLEESSFRKQ